MASQHAFKIIIVGCGIAGLVLAKMLEKFDIDYVILEAHSEIAPPVGASIGLMPDGLLILDQIGCYEAVRAKAVNYKIATSHIRDTTGKSVSCTKGFMGHLERRHFYSMLFLDRQWLLQVLYDELRHKDRILLQSRVKTIVPLDAGASVVTTDGRTFTGDIIVGADGIHSVVRHEMRRLADELRPGFMPPGEEDLVTCYYQCLFGISVDVENWLCDDQTFTNGCGASFLVASGPHKRVYWFCFARLPEEKRGQNIPRYNKEDEMRFVEEHGPRAITESLTFSELYAKRISSTLTPLHEVVFKNWGFERIVLVGDSAHKPNPISGAGGNATIETAAEFINALLRARDSRPGGLMSGITASEVEAISQDMQKARVRRVKGLVQAAHDMQALFAYERRFVSSLFHSVLPLLGGDFSLEQLASRYAGGIRLQQLPVPARPRAIPFDHELPAKPLRNRLAKHARSVFVVLMALVLLFSPGRAFPERPGPRPTCSGEYLGVLAWTTSGMGQIIFAMLVYVIECSRVGHQGTLLRIYPILVGAMLLLGLSMGDTVPLFAILSAFQSFRRPSGRPIDLRSLRIVSSVGLKLLLLVLVIVQIFQVIAWPWPGSHWQTWLERLPLVFRAYPFAMVLFCVQSWQFLNRGEPDCTDSKGFDLYKDSDVSKLIVVYWCFFLVQAGAHIAAVAYSYSYIQYDVWSSLQSVLFETLPPSVWIGMVGHCLYSVWELRRLGFVATSRAMPASLAVIVGQALFGPGAIWAATWVWREAVIAQLSTLNRPIESSNQKGGEIKADIS
ncbi:hypothetical protein B0T14DRAFT_433542 [Immersiella caudata]|uniref:FAD-binding domain-containing protein n=1 Tax=Immersiella caudata TaxID=314043 RepID=A0AA40BWU8_9PEZI|nr:hypothetical protein B0T14DRAFT_433542 [Immersiella caudata]